MGSRYTSRLEMCKKARRNQTVLTVLLFVDNKTTVTSKCKLNHKLFLILRHLFFFNNLQETLARLHNRTVCSHSDNTVIATKKLRKPENSNGILGSLCDYYLLGVYFKLALTEQTNWFRQQGCGMLSLQSP